MLLILSVQDIHKVIWHKNEVILNGGYIYLYHG